jgi:hypothetical protein
MALALFTVLLSFLCPSTSPATVAIAPSDHAPSKASAHLLPPFLRGSGPVASKSLSGVVPAASSGPAPAVALHIDAPVRACRHEVRRPWSPGSDPPLCA